MREKMIELIFVGQVLADSMCDKQAECNKCPYSSPNACRMGAMVDHLIANGVTIQKWIPVTERLPEKDGIYLTFSKKKEYEFHFFQTGKRMWPAVWDEDGVTHWMPLPEPPKET